jgi:hypothetical protein
MKKSNSIELQTKIIKEKLRQETNSYLHWRRLYNRERSLNMRRKKGRGRRKKKRSLI